MNIDIQNIGHYRVTSHGGRRYDLYNRDNGNVIAITASEWHYILDSMSVEACHFVERTPRVVHQFGT